MMRRLFQLGTVLFWLGILSFWWLGNSGEVTPSEAAAPPKVAAPAAVPPAERRIPLSEVARHATPADCWMAIRGGVYDLSPYLPDHPTRPAVIEPWCGKEATEAYATKGRGRPHAAGTDTLLAQYRIGVMVP